MKKKLNRALNAFAAMDDLPESMLLEAEQALLDAEGGLPSPKKPPNGFVRFLNSGWGAAVISGIVALGVLAFVIRAGREPATYEPPKKPVGSTIEMSTEGVDYTLSMEQASYDEGKSRITVVMTGRNKGESISMFNAWHLERLTENGAEVVRISYTEEAIESAKPGRDAYATIQKSINVEEPLTVGHYRLHATKHDGEKYVSVAWCTFTVGDPGELTWISETETAPATDSEPPAESVSELVSDPSAEPDPDPTIEYPPASDRPYTVSTADTMEYGATGLGITVKAVEQGAILFPHRNYRIVKLAGPANGDGAVWMQTAEAVEVLPTEEYGGYAVYQDSLILNNHDQWLPGLYRLYALNHNDEYIDYCDFVIKGDHGLEHEMFLSKNTYTTTDTELKVQILGHEKGARVTWYEGWSLYAVDGETRTLLGSCSPILIAYESPIPAEDEFVLLDIGQSISNATNGKYETLSVGDYELVFGSGDQAHRMPFTVVEDTREPLTTDDPDKTVARGTFFWANGHPFINLPWGGESGVYPVSFTVENDSIDFTGLTSGDTVEIVMAAFVEESFPGHSYLYELRKLSDGTLSDLPDGLIKAMEDMGYSITETSE